MLNAEARSVPFYKVNMLVGSTAVLSGDLLKKDGSGALIPVADNDVNITIYVASSDAPAAGQVTVDVSQIWLKEITYTGSAPTVGESFGVSNQRTLDTADTTNLLLTVLEVDTDRTAALVTPYRITD